MIISMQTLPAIPRSVQAADIVLVVTPGARLPQKRRLRLRRRSVGGAVDLVWATHLAPSGIWAHSSELLGERLHVARSRESCAETLLGLGGDWRQLAARQESVVWEGRQVWEGRFVPNSSRVALDAGGVRGKSGRQMLWKQPSACRQIHFAGKHSHLRGMGSRLMENRAIEVPPLRPALKSQLRVVGCVIAVVVVVGPGSLCSSTPRLALFWRLSVQSLATAHLEGSCKAGTEGPFGRWPCIMGCFTKYLFELACTAKASWSSRGMCQCTHPTCNVAISDLSSGSTGSSCWSKAAKSNHTTALLVIRSRTERLRFLAQSNLKCDLNPVTRAFRSHAAEPSGSGFSCRPSLQGRRAQALPLLSWRKSASQGLDRCRWKSLVCL
ncbi:unnamed protein product [Polarella glacialis]|uniref:Uncharacterized protein n=1 Tax=Polarella glacialis TaxID=89957 RepID=A0A813I6C2_POLGL|nr:unnamed protein product [Polarella glacialis]